MELAETYILEEKKRLLRQYNCQTLHEVIAHLESVIKLKNITP